jgi:hypothetical protein
MKNMSDTVGYQQEQISKLLLEEDCNLIDLRKNLLDLVEFVSFCPSLKEDDKIRFFAYLKLSINISNLL